jgi:hypothetical protein
MLKYRHPEVFKNYSKIRVMSVKYYGNKIGMTTDNALSTQYIVIYNNVKYLCDDIPTGKFSAERNYTIKKLED